MQQAVFVCHTTKRLSHSIDVENGKWACSHQKRLSVRHRHCGCDKLDVPV